MKQKYVKPTILVERFTLTQSIAFNCGVSPSGNTMGKHLYSSPYSCAWDVGGFKLFMVGVDVCADEQIEENEPAIDGACYNNPEGMVALFSST